LDDVKKFGVPNARLGIAQGHRKGLVLVVVWTDGVSPGCWKREREHNRAAEHFLIIKCTIAI
jgi:hypothetical protein